MMTIGVQAIDQSQFGVTVPEGGSSMTHVVTVPDLLFQKLTGGKAFRIAGLEQPDEFHVGGIVEAFVRERHQLAGLLREPSTAARSADTSVEQRSW